MPFSPLQITVRTLLDLSNSLGTLISQRKFSRKKKLGPFRRRDRMILKQITPPKDITFLKLGLSLVSEEHSKVGNVSNLWFLYSLCKCEKNKLRLLSSKKVGF